MLREACVSGEDRGDIDIDTEVLKEITPLAQDRGARNSHYLAIVAGIGDERPNNLHITLFPCFHKNLAPSPKFSPKNRQTRDYGITANHRLGNAQTKKDILCVE